MTFDLVQIEQLEYAKLIGASLLTIVSLIVILLFYRRLNRLDPALFYRAAKSIREILGNERTEERRDAEQILGIRTSDPLGIASSGITTMHTQARQDMRAMRKDIVERVRQDWKDTNRTIALVFVSATLCSAAALYAVLLLTMESPEQPDGVFAEVYGLVGIAVANAMLLGALSDFFESIGFELISVSYEKGLNIVSINVFLARLSANIISIACVIKYFDFRRAGKAFMEEYQGM
ncbi:MULTISPECIES: hypothetical protein [Alphaproteobacteria]|uniref:Uncharacterized protein n=1 Tax=Frigidibacter mobilis TaxID=1335048 RepID=A0A165SP94_9RHOB|nr:MULTISPECIES: hypothetical protein [Alphaproteobacteria]AMY69813.1 hypothetical protein AKL17_2570 [Frigidibacter mobilis]MDP3411346.1 hypothetical protein [Bosea sp. (in: a-proteobacteria)]